MAIKNVRAIYFPYCIKKQEDGSWILLNRNYKPVGLNTDEFIKYEEYPVSIRLKGIGLATLKKLSYKNEQELEDRVYLYNDGCVPTSSVKAMTNYLKKLEILLKMKNA